MRDDVVAIEQLLNRYCHLLDRGDIDGVVALFADDAVLIPSYEGDVQYPGRAAIRDWYTRYAATSIAGVRGLRHRISTAMIEIAGSAACSVCYLDADSISRANGRRTLVGGRYEDRLVRVAEDWRLTERRIVIDYATTLPGATDG